MHRFLCLFRFQVYNCSHERSFIYLFISILSTSLTPVRILISPLAENAKEISLC